MDQSRDYNLDKADRTMQLVEEFENHWVLERAGWDVKALSYLVETGIMGGRVHRTTRKYMTSEFYLILAFQVRADAIKNRVQLE